MKLYRLFENYLKEKKLWEVFIYLFFGGLATLVNIISFTIANSGFQLSWTLSNTISWIFSVLFAFVTNKLWVFHSKSESFGAFIWEFIKFILARLVSYGMDMACMFLLIDIVMTGNLIAKLITQVIVVVANYFFSKLFIFKKVEIIEEEKTNSSAE